MSFLNESLPLDAQAWSERIIPSLAERGQGLARNPVQSALERLSVSADLEDLMFVCNEIEKYETRSEKTTEVQCAARRLTVYRVAAGDITAWPLLRDDLVSRGRTLTTESEELWEVTSTLLGLIRNINRPQWTSGRRDRSLGDFRAEGSSVLSRFIRSARVREDNGDKNSDLKEAAASPTDKAPVPNAVGPSFRILEMRPQKPKLDLALL